MQIQDVVGRWVTMHEYYWNSYELQTTVEMKKNIISLIFIYSLSALRVFCQEEEEIIRFNPNSIGAIYNKRNLPQNLMTFLDTTFHYEVAYFKRRGYGNPFNRPTRNVRLAFCYEDDYIIYFKYFGRAVQDRVIVVDTKGNIKLKATYCGFEFANSPEDLLEKLNRCGTIIENI